MMKTRRIGARDIRISRKEGSMHRSGAVSGVSHSDQILGWPGRGRESFRSGGERGF